MRDSMSGIVAAITLGAVLGLGPAMAWAQDAPAAEADAEVELFGDMEGIDTEEAGSSVEEAQAYFDGLNPDQQDGVRERCMAFAAAVDQPESSGQRFCANLIEAGVIEDAPAR